MHEDVQVSGIFKCANLWYMAASIHTHFRNAVPLVWGSLGLAPTKDGFRIGFNWSRAHQSANHNMPPAALHAEVIEDNIRGEIEEQRLFGPSKAGDLNPPVHISKFGVIEKKHKVDIQSAYRIAILPIGIC